MSERAFRAAFSDYVAELEAFADSMTEQELALNIGALPFEQAKLGYLEAMTAALKAELEVNGIKAIGDLGLPDAYEERAKYFAVDNPRAIAFAEQHAAELVTEVSTATELALKETVAAAFTEHRDVKSVARLVRGYKDRSGVVHRGIVGLHPKDAKAVARNLENLKLAGWSADEAGKISAKHAKKLLMNRGENIARTETAIATEQGKLASWQALQDEGIVSPQSVRVWFTSYGERTCEICLPLHNETVPLNEPFSDGSMGPPAHPRCACSVNIRVIVPGMSDRRSRLPEMPSQRTIDRKIEENRKYRAAQQRRFNSKYRPTPK